VLEILAFLLLSLPLDAEEFSFSYGIGFGLKNTVSREISLFSSSNENKSIGWIVRISTSTQTIGSYSRELSTSVLGVTVPIAKAEVKTVQSSLFGSVGIVETFYMFSLLRNPVGIRVESGIMYRYFVTQTMYKPEGTDISLPGIKGKGFLSPYLGFRGDWFLRHRFLLGASMITPIDWRQYSPFVIFHFGFFY
jgi:hypothetical protein